MSKRVETCPECDLIWTLCQCQRTTFRRQCAVAAMQGYLANGCYRDRPCDLADAAWLVADAMLEEEEARQGGGPR